MLPGRSALSTCCSQSARTLSGSRLEKQAVADDTDDLDGVADVYEK